MQLDKGYVCPASLFYFLAQLSSPFLVGLHVWRLLLHIYGCCLARAADGDKSDAADALAQAERSSPQAASLPHPVLGPSHTKRRHPRPSMKQREEEEDTT